MAWRYEISARFVQSVAACGCHLPIGDVKRREQGRGAVVVLVARATCARSPRAALATHLGVALHPSNDGLCDRMHACSSSLGAVFGVGLCLLWSEASARVRG